VRTGRVGVDRDAARAGRPRMRVVA
jgi:hypothetical protein